MPVKIYDKEGKSLDVHEVDAKELVASGEYTREAPDDKGSRGRRATETSRTEKDASEEKAQTETVSRGPGWPPSRSTGGEG